MTDPLLSVGVIAGGQRRRVSRCLESLLAQEPIDRMDYELNEPRSLANVLPHD